MISMTAESHKTMIAVLITFANEHMAICCVCAFVSKISQKQNRTEFDEIIGEVGLGPRRKCLDFGGGLDFCVDFG